MIALFPARKALRILPCVLALFLVLSCLSGCDTEGYPKDMRYGLRTDPIFPLEPIKDETRVPDQPGQFPVMSVQAMLETGNPLNAFYKAKSKEFINPAKLTSEQSKQIREAVDGLFGKPATPFVSIDTAQEAALKLEPARLLEGSRLYRIHCLHCHGLAGDGRGPTAPWINPHPRDFRLGIFKFVSTDSEANNRKPSRADLLHTLKVGLDGSSMPAFNVLPDSELEDIISYVIHLSLRGEVEAQLIQSYLAETPPSGTAKEQAVEFLTAFAQPWLEAQNKELKPEPYPYEGADPTSDKMKASVKRGQEYFLSKDGQCATCHADYGRTSTYRFDLWGTMVKPRDLTSGIYRGGRRPLDIYRRVALGINGAGMIASKKPLADSAKAGKASIWDVVNFVQVMPYPEMRKLYGINVD